MLTGRRAFKGDDVPDTLAAVLRQDVELDGAPGRRRPRGAASARALSRSRRQAAAARHRRSADRARDPDALAREDPGRPARRRAAAATVARAMPVVLTAIVAGALAGTAAWYLSRPSVPAAAVTRFRSRCPKDRRSRRCSASADSAVAGRRTDRCTRRTPGCIHAVDVRARRAAIQAPKTISGVTDPVFSPDGQSLIFYATADRTIKKIPVDWRRSGDDLRALTLHTA